MSFILSLNLWRGARTVRASLVAIVVLLVAACGGGGGDGGSTTTSSSCPVTRNNGTLNERVFAYLQDWYLWCDQLPVPGVNGFDPNRYTSVDALVDAIRYLPNDRFSFVDTFESYSALFNQGQVSNYGFGYTRRSDATYVVIYVEPGSPAQAGGLKRGQQILSVNGTSVAQLDLNGGIGVILATGATVGTPVQLDVLENGLTRTLNLVSGTYVLQTVWNAQLLRPLTGYFSLKSFLTTTTEEVRQATAGTEWDNVNQLVLDLRYNGGGLVSVARDLASRFLGAGFDRQVFAALEYNVNHTASNFTFSLANPRSPSLSIRRIVALVSPRTCSASEETIAALQSFVPVTIIATTADSDGRFTCGKPVGFNPQLIEIRPGIANPLDPVIFAVNFRSKAANGFTDYYNGFTPTCVVTDNLSQPLHGAGDSMLNAALSYLDTGKCPAVAIEPAGARAQVQSSGVAGQPVTPRQDERPPGVRGIHYSW